MGNVGEGGSGPPIRIGVSACLVGHNARYDGSHKLDRYLTHTLGRFFELVPFCPQVDAGLSAPRDALRLVRQRSEVRLVMPSTGRDLTRQMESRAKGRVSGLAREDLSGCILKSKSLNCGLRVPTFTPHGRPARWSAGRFADVLTTRLPNVPVIEEAALQDARFRENWIERVFAYGRLQQFWSGRWKLDDLVQFHAAHKYLLLSHSPTAYGRIGRMLAAADSMPKRELRRRYESELMAALARPATRTRHTTVLRQMLGKFQGDLDSASRGQVLEAIRDYRRGVVPRLFPLAVIRHYVRLLEFVPLGTQVYLNPHPKELALRCHA